jgi:hypothetical protein
MVTVALASGPCQRFVEPPMTLGSVHASHSGNEHRSLMNQEGGVSRETQRSTEATFLVPCGIELRLRADGLQLRQASVGGHGRTCVMWKWKAERSRCVAAAADDPTFRDLISVAKSDSGVSRETDGMVLSAARGRASAWRWFMGSSGTLITKPRQPPGPA